MTRPARKGKSREKVDSRYLFRDESKLVKRINESLAITRIGNKVVFPIKESDGEIAFLERGGVASLYAPYKLLIESEGKDGDVRVKAHPGFGVWLASEDRKEYRRVVFDPSDSHAPDELNLWRGFAVAPVEGDTSLYWNHVRDVICDGDEESFRFIHDWMINLVTAPADKPGTSLVLRGPKGIGKNTFVEWLQAILAYHEVLLDKAEHAIGKFNAILQARVLVILDEAFWAGDKNAEGALKNLITGDTIVVEPKGVDALQIANHVHVVVLANSAWVVPATHDERRFLVCDVSERHKDDAAYWDAMAAAFEANGPAALLYDLQHRTPFGVDLRRPPKTAGLAKQVVHGFDAFHRWWHDVLEVGMLPTESCDEDHAAWQGWKEKPLLIERQAVFDHFTAAMSGAWGRRGVTKNELGVFLKSEIPTLQTVRPMQEGKRVRLYCFPPLNELRHAFAAKHGVTFVEDAEIDALDASMVMA